MIRMADDYAQSFDSTLSPLGQALVGLSGNNSQSLLSEASHQIHSRHGEAKSILHRLKQLNPAIGAQFQPKDDILSELRLRLLSPKQTAPPEFSSFLVVSYCWHYREWPLVPAAQPIAPGWEVSQPMVNAIMGLRDGPEEGVWLDKLCINQASVRDKQVHIGAMDIIYRSARRVVILLEDVQLTIEEEVAGQTYAGFYADMCTIVREQDFEDSAKADFVNSYFPSNERMLQDEGKGDILVAIRSFMAKFLSARWFSRAWCAHESRVVPHLKQNNPLFLCYGHDGRVLPFEFRCIHYIATYFSNLEPETLTEDTAMGDALNQQNPTSLPHQYRRIQRLMPQMNFSSSDMSSMQHICNIVSSGCLKSGDLISIALNTSSIPLVFTGTTTSVEEVIWIFSLLVLASNDVVPLIMNGIKLKFIDDLAKKTIISWVVNPTQGILDMKMPIRISDSITEVTRDYVELDLLVFPSLPSAASPKAFEAALEIIKAHQLDSLPRINSDDVAQRNVDLMRAEMRRTRGDEGPLKNFLPKWLAHALDCGIEWTTRLPDLILKETEEGGWMHGILGDAVDERLTVVAEAMFAHFIAEEAGEDPASKASHIKKLTRFLTCLLDPKWILFATTTPRCHPCGRNDFVFTPSISNRSWIAVPAAVTHLPSWHNRAWVVEPFDPASETPEDPKSHLPYLDTEFDSGKTFNVKYPVSSSDLIDRRAPRNAGGTWKLRRRDCIFGSHSLATQSFANDDGKGPVLVKKQRVYGAEDYDWSAIMAAGRSLSQTIQ